MKYNNYLHYSQVLDVLCVDILYIVPLCFQYESANKTTYEYYNIITDFII